MKTYRPKSWSAQARELADNYLAWDDKKDALDCLKNSYRHPRIKYRAIKRFVRKMKKTIDK